MPLDDIIFQSPIKRKAIKATPTICRFCNTKFIDKYYKGELTHKVRCPRCNRINAELSIEDYDTLQEQAFRHDVGTHFVLGGMHRTGTFRKMVKEAFALETDEEIEQKLKEIEYNVRMEEYKKKLEEEKMKKLAKIRIKRKGEEEKTL